MPSYGVLYVPIGAVVSRGTKHYCYVRAVSGIDKVEVVPGVRGEGAVEITSGLTEGQQVLSDPTEHLRPLQPNGK